MSKGGGILTGQPREMKHPRLRKCGGRCTAYEQKKYRHGTTLAVELPEPAADHGEADLPLLDSGQHSLGLWQLSFLNFDLRGTNLQVDNLVVSRCSRGAQIAALEVLKSCYLDNNII